jgi:hypothetical protein
MTRTSNANPTRRDPSTVLKQAVTAPVRAQTYKNLLYLVLAFPLGIAYFTGLVTGGALGGSLLVMVVGLPILLVTLSAATTAAGVEARLAESLVGVDASVPSFLGGFELEEGVVLPGDGFVGAIERLVTAPSTWTSVVLLLSKFVFGIVSFVAVVASTAIAAALLAAPFVYDDSTMAVGVTSPATASSYTVGSWTVSTLPEAMLVAGGGVLFALAALNLLNGLARVQAVYTATLLGVDGDT